MQGDRIIVDPKTTTEEHNASSNSIPDADDQVEIAESGRVDSPSPTPASPTTDNEEVPFGTGADVDIDGDSNVMLMIKLQVFQNDDEELIKLVRSSMVLLNFERPVHLLITNLMFYILTPADDNSSQGYSATIALPFHQIEALKVLSGGNLLRLSARNASGDFVWQFVTGDPDVSDAIYEALRTAMEKAGGDNTLPESMESSARWKQAISQFVAAEEGSTGEFEHHIGYYEVSAKGFRKEIIHSGMLDLKESGFLTDSWRPQYFQLQGRTLGQLDSRSTRTVKMKLTIDDPSFTCKRVPDAEGRHCLELSNSNLTITVGSQSFDDSECWFRALNGVNPCVLGTQDHLSPISKGGQWILVFIIRTNQAVYICRGDLSGTKLKLLASYNIDTFSALRAPLAGRGYLQIEFDGEDAEGDASSKLLFKTVSSLKHFSKKICESWKELYQVELHTNGL